MASSGQLAAQMPQPRQASASISATGASARTAAGRGAAAGRSTSPTAPNGHGRQAGSAARRSRPGSTVAADACWRPLEVRNSWTRAAAAAASVMHSRESSAPRRSHRRRPPRRASRWCGSWRRAGPTKPASSRARPADGRPAPPPRRGRGRWRARPGRAAAGGARRPRGPRPRPPASPRRRLDRRRRAAHELDTGTPGRQVPGLVAPRRGAQLLEADGHPHLGEERAQPDGVLEGDHAAEAGAVREAPLVARAGALDHDQVPGRHPAEPRLPLPAVELLGELDLGHHARLAVAEVGRRDGPARARSRSRSGPRPAWSTSRSGGRAEVDGVDGAGGGAGAAEGARAPGRWSAARARRRARR